MTVLAAVFNGNPAGAGCDGDPQACNRYGLDFKMTGGALAMSELQYAVNQDKKAAGLPGVYKLGAWYANTDFPDAYSGVLNKSGDWGIYGVADQMVWRGRESSVNLFMRGGFSPSDRNLVSYYVDGGIGIKGLLPGRADDVLTFGAAYIKVSSDVAAFDRRQWRCGPFRRNRARARATRRSSRPGGSCSRTCNTSSSRTVGRTGQPKLSIRPRLPGRPAQHDQVLGGRAAGAALIVAPLPAGEGHARCARQRPTTASRSAKFYVRAN